MPKFEVWVEEMHIRVWPEFIVAEDEDEALEFINNACWSNFQTMEIVPQDLRAIPVVRGQVRHERT